MVEVIGSSPTTPTNQSTLYGCFFSLVGVVVLARTKRMHSIRIGSHPLRRQCSLGKHCQGARIFVHRTKTQPIHRIATNQSTLYGCFFSLVGVVVLARTKRMHSIRIGSHPCREQRPLARRWRGNRIFALWRKPNQFVELPPTKAPFMGAFFSLVGVVVLARTKRMHSIRIGSHPCREQSPLARRWRGNRIFALWRKPNQFVELPPTKAPFMGAFFRWWG